MKWRRRVDTALKAAQRAVAARDEGVCLVCGKPADDIAKTVLEAGAVAALPPGDLMALRDLLEMQETEPEALPLFAGA